MASGRIIVLFFVLGGAAPTIKHLRPTDMALSYLATSIKSFIAYDVGMFDASIN